ncbi:hypothetical protein HPB51_010969 [Rhipicephalus microplus]|uniref:Transposable element n=1 Tax=Rhipicephalus microplus TaxID=6941 RepID=A0A9J6DVI5_RHIMP|nr:hypothetical protein HPB51_010969 [Rhipicephalus microplus]
MWAHYDKLYVENSKLPGYLRGCPKLTFSHMNPSSTEKMRVKLATQVFSRSVAKGLEYYSSRGASGLQDVKATVDFTLKMNDLFDALNRSHPKEELRQSSKDLRVLASSLHWLNTWERELVSGTISREDFLTESTAEGLRVTILSAIQLSKYLLETCGFNYVLTAKFNQDVLKRFFGIIRQAAGQNEHPSMPTFLQLYNMLSIYSLIKPPKFGNCEVQNANEPQFLALSDFTSAFQVDCEQETKLEELKRKLDGLVDADVECEEAFAHVFTSEGRGLEHFDDGAVLASGTVAFSFPGWRKRDWDALGTVIACEKTGSEESESETGAGVTETREGYCSHTVIRTREQRNLGHDISIPQERWEHLMAQPKDFLFVREAGNAIWGVHNLYNTSITGTPCHRFLHKEGIPPSVEKRALTPRKLDALRRPVFVVVLCWEKLLAKCASQWH